MVQLVADLVEARRAEGRQLEQVVTGQVDRIAALTQAAEENPARQPEAVRARLEAAVAALGGSGLDPDRLHQEAMLLAGKADVREELDRLRAHVASARDLLAAGGAIGRRLDFLAQEFGREANTLCAKANDISLSDRTRPEGRGRAVPRAGAEHRMMPGTMPDRDVRIRMRNVGEPRA